MTITHSQQESDAMAAFLALSDGTLEQRAKAWLEVVQLIAKRPKEVVEQMEIDRGIDGR